MGNKKRKQTQSSSTGNVFKVAEGRAHKAKHQKIKKKFMKVIHTELYEANGLSNSKPLADQSD